MTEQSDGDPIRPRWLAALVAAVLVAIAAWEIVAIRLARATPDEDWRAAAAIVRERYQIGDLIVFAPRWADPIGRLHLGDLIPIDAAARMDADRYARIWELSIRGATAPETRALAPAQTFSAGGVEIRFYQRTPVTVLADVRALLPTAKVQGGRATLELAEVGFEPHRCIQVVPSPAQPVRVTFPKLPAGKLVGYVGLADIFTRREIRRPGRLVVELADGPSAGHAIAEVVPGVDDGWVRFEVAVPGGDVAFVASADAPQRQICFAAEVRP